MELLEYVLLLTLSINAMLFLSQAAVLNTNPDGAEFFNCQGTSMGQFEANNCTGTSFQLSAINPGEQLPSGDGSISATTGSVYTDRFIAIKNYIINSVPGLAYLTSILNAPSIVLTALFDVPEGVSFAIQTLWYSFTMFLIIGYLLPK